MMSKEEWQRQIEFIVNTLASVSAKLDEVAEMQRQSEKERLAFERQHQGYEQERKADALRLARVEESYVTMTRLLERYEERLDNHDTRIVDMEQVMEVLTRLLEKYEDGKS